VKARDKRKRRRARLARNLLAGKKPNGFPLVLTGGRVRDEDGNLVTFRVIP
jgi:hypothetical protein